MTNRWSSLPRSLSSQWVSSSWRQIKNAVCSLTKSFAGITRGPSSTWRRLCLLSGRSLKEQRSQPSLATSLSELSSIGGPWQNSCARRRHSLSGNPRGSFSLRRRRLAVVHLHMLRLYNGFRTPSPSRAISPSPFRGTPPRNAQAGVGDRGMSAPVVKGPEVGCTVLTTDTHFVPGAELRKELTKESSSLTLQEEFLSMGNPPEFQHLGLLDCQAPDQVGGRVSWFVQNWEKIVQDPWVLSVVRTGYRIEWLSRPSQSAAPLQPTFSQDMNLLVDTEVQEMLLKGAIEEVVPVPGQYVSSIFLVSKKDGGSRPVINLKQLNHLVLYEHIQMEGLGTLLNSVATGEFLTKLDLKDVYFTLPIHQVDRKYLRFRWGGKLYQFRVLPFGLSSAPRVFTRVLKAPMAFLQKQGLKSVVYLDDFCLVNPHALARKKTLTTAWLLSRLGFVVNWKKVLDTSFSEGGVPGLHSGHRQFSGGAPSTQSGQDHGLLYGAVGAETVLREDTGFPDREAPERVHSNLTCSPSFSPYADGQHQGSSQATAKLCCKSGVAGGCVGRVEMVVEESSDVEWKVIPQSRSASGCCDNIRWWVSTVGGPSARV